MKLVGKIIIVFLMTTSLTACQSSGRTYTQLKSDGIPKIEDGKGRIFLYRYTTLGAAVTPTINLNGQAIGESVAEGFFYSDAIPGEKRVSASTEVEKSVQFELKENETVYIKQDVGIGWLAARINFLLADKEQAENDMADLHYQNDSESNNSKETK